jgi:hypothetical protein
VHSIIALLLTLSVFPAEIVYFEMKVKAKIVNLPVSEQNDPSRVCCEQGLEMDVDASTTTILDLKQRVYALLCREESISMPENAMVIIIRGRIAQNQQTLQEWLFSEEIEEGLVVHAVLRNGSDIRQVWCQKAKTEARHHSQQTAREQEASRMHEDTMRTRSFQLPTNYHGPVLLYDGIPYILQHWNGLLPPVRILQEETASNVAGTYGAEELQAQRAEEHPPPGNALRNDENMRVSWNHYWIAMRLTVLVYILAQNGGPLRLMFLSIIAFLVYLYQCGKIRLHVHWQYRSRRSIRPTLFSLRQSWTSTSQHRSSFSAWISKFQLMCVCFIGSLIPGGPYEDPRFLNLRNNEAAGAM